MRFDKIQIAQHMTLAVTFILLVLTGFAMSLLLLAAGAYLLAATLGQRLRQLSLAPVEDRAAEEEEEE